MPKSKNVRDQSELRRLTGTTALERAFQLAHSIYNFREKDRAIALEIVWEALRGVGVRLTAQREADRHDPQKPTKVRWNTLQWFQILIYCKSEIYEKQQETTDSSALTQKDMIIRYIKHLILATSRRNSFHISLGLTRLLYDYRTAEAMAIYDLIFQDPDISTRKADAYYRGRKNRLLEELEKRFGELIQTNQGARGGKRLHPQNDSTPFRDATVHALTRFTPWETSCALPTPLDTWASVHSLRGSQASQIHALIHPTCFSRIVEALNLDPPEKKLTLPFFFLSKNRVDGGDSPDDGPLGEPLTEEEVASIRKRVREEDVRRRKFTPQSLRILTDGNERARFDLSESSLVRFEIPNDVTLIEVIGVREDDELLLATHVLTEEQDDLVSGQSNEYSIVLKRGQMISLSVSLAHSGDEDKRNFAIEVRYQETGAASAASPGQSLLGQWLAQKVGLQNLRKRPPLSPAFVIALAALVLTGLILFVALRNRSVPEEVAQRQPPPTVLITPTPVPTPTLATTPNGTNLPSTPKPTPSNANDDSQPGTTRGPNERATKSLGSIEHLYVGLAETDAYSRAVRQKVIEKLRALNRFAVTGGQGEADTTLYGVIRSGGKRRDEKTGLETEIGTATMELVNVTGEVIWRTRRFSGTADQVADQFTNDLLEALRREGRR